jgi:diaminopimelate epimerase
LLFESEEDLLPVKFTKMHGAGNDFVVIDCRRSSGIDYAKYAQKICDRRTGIGCDQLLILHPSEKADFFMQILNNDGSPAQMCGNGIRCVAAFAAKRDGTSKNEFRIDTLSGIKKVSLISSDEAVVDMGTPIVDVVNKKHVFNKIEYNISTVSLGNPHCVLLGDDTLLEQVGLLGPVIEKDKLFPERTNVEFVMVKDRRNLTVKVWERGAGETLACGSGACASMVVAYTLGLVEGLAFVNMRGGQLKIGWNGKGNVSLQGKISFAYEGEFELERLGG